MARPVSLGTRYTRIKNVLKNSLDERGIYDPSDELLLNETMYTIKIIDDCKQDIKKKGLQINTVKDPDKDPYYQANPSIATYNKAVSNLSNLLTKLAITPQERQKLDIEAEKSDPLGELLGSSSPKQSVKN